MLLILSAPPKKESEKETLKAISNTLEKESLPHEIHPFNSILLFFSEKTIAITIAGRPLSMYTHIYFRKIEPFAPAAQIVACAAKKQNIPIIDSYIETLNSNTKLFHYYIFANKKLPFPRTFFSTQYDKIFLRSVTKTLRFPIVIKELQSSQGAGVHIAHTQEDLNKTVKRLHADGSLFVLQEYIPNDFDYRILVLGGKAQVAEKKIRTNKNEFRNNVALGAQEEFLDTSSVDTNILRIAEKAALATNTDVAGVDIVTDKTTKTHYILEVNSAPQLTLDQTVSPEIAALSQFLLLWTKK